MFHRQPRRRKSLFEVVWTLPFRAESGNRSAFETPIRTAGGAVGYGADESAPSFIPLGNFLAHEIHLWGVAPLALDQGQIPSGLAGKGRGRRADPKTYFLFGGWLPGCFLASEKSMKVIVSKTFLCVFTLPLALLSACGKKDSPPPP